MFSCLHISFFALSSVEQVVPLACGALCWLNAAVTPDCPQSLSEDLTLNKQLKVSEDQSNNKEKLLSC